jgi:hypothetical protein
MNYPAGTRDGARASGSDGSAQYRFRPRGPHKFYFDPGERRAGSRVLQDGDGAGAGYSGPDGDGEAAVDQLPTNSDVNHLSCAADYDSGRSTSPGLSTSSPEESLSTTPQRPIDPSSPVPSGWGLYGTAKQAADEAVMGHVERDMPRIMEAATILQAALDIRNEMPVRSALPALGDTENELMDLQLGRAVEIKGNPKLRHLEVDGFGGGRPVGAAEQHTTNDEVERDLGLRGKLLAHGRRAVARQEIMEVTSLTFHDISPNMSSLLDRNILLKHLETGNGKKIWKGEVDL